jgi:hypothetical protein
MDGRILWVVIKYLIEFVKVKESTCQGLGTQGFGFSNVSFPGSHRLVTQCQNHLVYLQGRRQLGSSSQVPRKEEGGICEHAEPAGAAA